MIQHRHPAAIAQGLDGLRRRPDRILHLAPDERLDDGIEDGGPKGE